MRLASDGASESHLGRGGVENIDQGVAVNSLHLPLARLVRILRPAKPWPFALRRCAVIRFMSPTYSFSGICF